MMEKLIQKVVARLIQKGSIPEEDRELYEYAVFNLVITVSPLVIVMIVGCLMRIPLKGVLFIIPFLVIRKFSGGYHTKHPLTCFILSCAVLIICMVLIQYLTYNWILIVITILAMGSIILCSPIESINRDLGLDRNKIKKICSFLIVFFAIVSLVLIMCKREDYAVCIFTGIILTASLQIPCIVHLPFTKHNSV